MYSLAPRLKNINLIDSKSTLPCAIVQHISTIEAVQSWRLIGKFTIGIE